MSPPRITRFGRQILAEAVELGVRDIAISKRGKHYLLTGKRNDRTVYQFFAATPSDWRAERNIKSGIRRKISR